MNMILYNNKSDNRTLNKDITEVSTVSMTLKDGNNIMSPVIILSADYLPPAANYAFISALSRYYYITAQRILPGNQLEISLKVDVLMSHKELIKSAQVVAKRSTNLPNKRLPDNIPILANRNIIYKAFFGGSKLFGSDKVNSESKCYLLSVMNGGYST